MKNIRVNNGSFKTRAAQDGMVRIAGYINKFGTVDCYGTRFDPKSVRLERFMQNPILLFNHDVDAPIGRMVSVELKEDGVWGEGVVSASLADKVSYVRDLIADGSLKAFSFRFNADAPMEIDPEIKGAMIVSNWELQEVSVVSVPAQPESVFSLRNAQAAFSNVRSLQEARVAMTNVRGAQVAKCVSDAIKKAVAEGLDEDTVVKRLRDEAGIEAGELSDLIAGQTSPCPENFLAACVTVLGCDREELNNLNGKDVELSQEKTETPADVDVKVDEIVARFATLSPEIAHIEAVEMAIKMCSPNDEWLPTHEQLERIMKMTKRQATQEPGETTPVKMELPNDNAMLQKFDSVISLMGALLNEFKMFNKPETKAMPEEKKPDTMAAVPPMAEKKEDEMTEEEVRAMEIEFERGEARLRALGL